jgi:hypothetical protein
VSYKYFNSDIITYLESKQKKLSSLLDEDVLKF